MTESANLTRRLACDAGTFGLIVGFLVSDLLSGSWFIAAIEAVLLVWSGFLLRSSYRKATAVQRPVSPLA